MPHREGPALTTMYMTMTFFEVSPFSAGPIFSGEESSVNIDFR